MLMLKMTRSVFARFVVSCLFTALLLSACKQEPDDPEYVLDKNLIGTWMSIYSDVYTVTETYLSYDDGYGSGYAGTIRHATAFSSTAGVIIIEYDADKKAMYPIYDDTWNPTGEYYTLKGNFIGVYYQDLKPGVSVKMSGAYIEGGAEEPNLDAAKEAFTVDREGDYMSYYGTYTK